MTAGAPVELEFELEPAEEEENAEDEEGSVPSVSE